MKQALIILLAIAAKQVAAQNDWTMQQCMQYAVEHNHEVKQAELKLDNYKAQKTNAVGSFLPYVDASIGAQYNFGRAIDPETNGYTDVSTFYNGYQLSALLPVFDGFSRLHALKAAKANETRLFEEVGRKSAADVAQVESQQAEADYELTRQQNLYASALLDLKKAMALPLGEELRVKSEKDNSVVELGMAETDSSLFTPHSSLSSLHPELQTARYQVQASKHEWRQARASFFPSLSLSAGLNTSYYKTLHSDMAASFRDQLNNNMGEYVGATLSIPLFNRLQTITNIRKAKNNYRIAQEALEQKRLELEKLSREAWLDWLGYQKQTAQMVKKVEADSIAYQLTKRQFEEGLGTAIDLHTTSTQLLKSKATLLQCQLMAMVKEHLVRYYRGEKIWE